MHQPTPRSPSRRLVPAVLWSCLFAAGCCAPPGARPGQIDHVVLVWLQQPGDAATIDRMCATARSFLGEIPGLVAVDCGTALPSDRDLVDDSFDVGLVMRFSDRQALDAYEVHPLHQRAVAEVLAPNAKRVVVHDLLVR